MWGRGRGHRGRPAQELSLRVRRSRLISSRLSGILGATRHCPLSGLAPTLQLPLGSNKGTGPPPRAQGRAVPQSTGPGAGVQREPAEVQWHERSPGPGPDPDGRPAKEFQSTPPLQPAWRGSGWEHPECRPWGRGWARRLKLPGASSGRGQTGQLRLNLRFLLGLPLETLGCSFTSLLARASIPCPKRHQCPGDAATASTKDAK